MDSSLLINGRGWDQGMGEGKGWEKKNVIYVLRVAWPMNIEIFTSVPLPYENSHGAYNGHFVHRLELI